MDEMNERDRDRDLPEFERDDNRTVGGGLMSQGGTSTDRGTGGLTGSAQGDDEEDEDETTEGLADDAPGLPIVPAGAAGSAGAPFVAAALDDEDGDRDMSEDEGR